MKARNKLVDNIRQGLLLLMTVIIIPYFVMDKMGYFEDLRLGLNVSDAKGILIFLVIILTEAFFYIGYKLFFPHYEDDLPDKFC